MMRPGRRASLGALSLLLAGALMAACGGDGSGDGETGALAGAAIRLEPAAEPQPDPFLDVNLDLAQDLAEVVMAEAVDPPATTDEVSTGLSGKTAEGTAAGLYGGSLDTAVCDGERFLAFVTDPANRAQADAWAEVQGITAEQIPEYFAKLTPVRLQLDTRVTNHGFDGTRPVPFQSVLQAGTAVLVDEQGVPRFKCFCGNPLTEPEPVEGDPGSAALDLDALAENPEDAWPDLDPELVVTVEPGEATGSFVLADPQTGERFERPTGTNGTDDTPAPTGGTVSTATSGPGTPPSSGGNTRGGGGGGSPGTYCENEYGPNGELVSRTCYAR